MWDLPGPGLEPVSLALAGGFLTTAPPGKSLDKHLNDYVVTHQVEIASFTYSVTQTHVSDLIHQEQTFVLSPGQACLLMQKVSILHFLLVIAPVISGGVPGQD